MGRMLLAANERGLRSVNFAASKRAERPQADWREDSAIFSETIRKLRPYFEGELREFDLPLAPEGTEFQMRVWRSLRDIPHRETISNAQLAPHYYSWPSGDRERWKTGGLWWRAGK